MGEGVQTEEAEKGQAMSTVKTSFRLTDPEQVQASMTITMSVHNWRRLNLFLKDQQAPGWWLANDICKLVDKATLRLDEEDSNEHA